LRRCWYRCRTPEGRGILFRLPHTGETAGPYQGQGPEVGQGNVLLRICILSCMLYGNLSVYWFLWSFFCLIILIWIVGAHQGTWRILVTICM
jgi:hypothetical protein